MLALHFVVLATALSGAHADFTSVDARARCQALLGRTIDAMDDGHQPVRFASRGRGPRDILSTSYPVLTGRSQRDAIEQAAFDWYDAISVQPSVAAARAHDRRYHGSQRINYVVSDVGLDSLKSTESVYPSEDPRGPGEVTHDEYRARRRAVAARFEHIFRSGRARAFYFDEPSFDPTIHDPSEPYLGLPQTTDRVTGALLEREIIYWDARDFELMFHADEMGFADEDGRGPVLRVNGYFSPGWRGVVFAETMFERKPGGGFKSGTVKDGLKLARSLVAGGWTITMNTNFRESLDLARGMTHDRRGQDARGERKGNSRYVPETVYRAALDAHAEGVSFSIEVRDPAGRLNTAAIGSRAAGRVVAMDTMMSNEPDDRLNLNLRKMLGVVASQWLFELGYPVVDVQTITNFTASLKGIYIPRETFLEHLRAPTPAWAASSATWVPPAQ